MCPLVPTSHAKPKRGLGPPVLLLWCGPRLAIFLIQILNYMWLEAMFINRNELDEHCFVVCPETQWLLRKVGAVVIAFFLSTPAMRIMCVLCMHDIGW